jgi:hypothetical protein
MKKNVGTIDKVVRILTGVVAGVLYFTHIVTGTPGLVLLLAGGVLILTSLISFCPLYRLLGLSTKKSE